MIKVSIIVPVYNVKEYLTRCVDSLIQQTYHDLEIILIDDGSTDGSSEVCDSFVQKDSRISVIHQCNQGLSAARNTGLSISSGKYVCFIDSDDWVSKYFVEFLVNTAVELNADIVECNYLKTHSLKDVPDDKPPEKKSLFYASQALNHLINEGVFHQVVWNKIYRRELVSDISFEIGKTNEDEFWTYQIFGRASRIIKIDNILYYYFQRPGSIINSTFSLRRLDVVEAKIQRQKYIENNYPELINISATNLAGTIIFLGQMSYKFLKGKDRKHSLRVLNSTYKQQIGKHHYKYVGDWKSKLWLHMAKISFLVTCKIKQITGIGF